PWPGMRGARSHWLRRRAHVVPIFGTTFCFAVRGNNSTAEAMILLSREKKIRKSSCGTTSAGMSGPAPSVLPDINRIGEHPRPRSAPARQVRFHPVHPGLADGAVEAAGLRAG